jgi:hypothetical protein
LALADAQNERSLQAAERDSIRAQFIRGGLTRADAARRLDEIGLRAEHRDALLDRWELEKKQGGERVPQGTIKELLKAQYITDVRARELLTGHGFPEDVITGLIALWGRRGGGGGGGET